MRLKANSGHPGLPMGATDIATTLYTRFLSHDPQNPHWPDRDRFVLSAGHGSMLLYSLLFLSGYEDITIDEIKNFRQLGSRTAGHLNMVMPQASKPRPVHLVRALPTLSAWRCPSAS